MKSRFSIYINGVKLMFTVEGTKRAAQRHIRTFLTATHMGGWRKIENGWAYDTTIGKYYEFRRE